MSTTKTNATAELNIENEGDKKTLTFSFRGPCWALVSLGAICASAYVAYLLT